MANSCTAGRRFRVCVLLGVLCWTNPVLLHSQTDDAGAVLQRVNELFEATGLTRALTPMPGSRSVVFTAEASAVMFLFVERGSLRGNAIDTFYSELEAGDVEAAYTTFNRNSIVSMRATDYGWNGLGQPLATESGTEVQDILYRVEESVFRRVDVTAEDADEYLGLLRDVLIPWLEAQG